MCGTAAALGPHADELCRMIIDEMSYRGVRSSFADHQGCTVGHVRLPIVGVGEEFDQPMRRRYWSVGYVGEVFGLDRSEYPCDSPFVMKRVAFCGPTAMVGSDGFWGIVAWHDLWQELFVITDYLGQKPMYVRTGDITAAASEITPLASLASCTIDRQYVCDVHRWGFCPDAWRTPFNEIRRVRPGHFARVTETTYDENLVDPLTRTPWSPSVDLQQMIDNAVRTRVEAADVPVGCLVSGGLDSTIVATLARKYGNVRTFHVENGEWDECRSVFPDAERISFNDVTDNECVEYMQEPLDLGSLAPQTAISKSLENKITVCLTGDGADEMLGGYSRSARYDSQQTDVWRELVSWHLPRLDRVMMRNCIEVRTPFLARNVASVCLGMPRGLRTNKMILREVFRGLIPDAITDRVKRPLRTKNVESSQSDRSARLVDVFMRQCIEKGIIDA